MTLVLLQIYHKMSCAVPGCKNNQRNCKKTFFTLPKKGTEAKAWIGRLNRKDTLPKKVLVCEDHFSEECFDPSYELKIRFQEQGKLFLFFFIRACKYKNQFIRTNLSSIYNNKFVFTIFIREKENTKDVSGRFYTINFPLHPI